MIPVTYRADPFRLDGVKQLDVRDGMTLLDIVSRITSQPDIFVVCVNGEMIDREWWGRIKPKTGTLVKPTLITLHPLPMGGKTGQILGVLAAVALIAGAAFISGGALAPLLGAGFAAGTFGASAAAAGLGIVGALAISALTAPPVQANSADGTESKTIAGVSINSISPGSYLPMVLGRMRVSPPPLMPSYTTLEDGDVYVNGIVGLAGAYTISNIWLNGSAIDLFEDVTYASKQGLPGDTAPSLNYTYSVQEQLPRLKLSQPKRQADSHLLVDTATPANSYSDFHIFNVHPPGDTGKIILRLFWPTGMNHVQADDDLTPGATPIRIEIKPRSSSVWYKLPDLHFRSKKEHNAEIRQQITLQWGSITSATYSPHANRTAWAAYFTAAPGTAFERDAEAVYEGVTEEYALGVSSDGDGFIIEVDNTAMDGDEEYDIRIRMGQGFTQSAFTTTTQAYAGDVNRGAFFGHYDTASTNGKQESASEQVYIESVASFNPLAPFDFQGLASISFQAKGIQIDSLSAEFFSIVPVWDGNSWATSQPSNNPAALYRFVCLTPDYNAQPIPGEILDEDNILEWFNHCITQEYECNAVVENQSMPSVLQMIASTGWASPRYTDLWGVVLERDRSGDNIMQMLTPLNSKDQGTTKQFPKMPHAIRVEYFDEVEEYEFRDHLVAYAPGFDENTASVYESVQYEGFTNSNKVLDRAQFDINQLYLRSVRYVRDVHHEGFLTPRGSLIGLVDEVIERAQRYSLIKTILTSGPNVTGFVLETIVDLDELATDPFALADPFTLTTFVADNQLGISVRLNDGSPSTHLITEVVASDTVTLATPVADTGQFEANQIVAIGVAGIEYKRVLVMAVEPHQGGEMFRLHLADERPELHA